MRVFVALLDLSGDTIPKSLCRQYDLLFRKRGIAYGWQFFGSVAVLTAGEPCEPASLVVSTGNGTAVGVVRLDNRAEVERWSGWKSAEASDLELVGRAVLQHGPRLVQQIIGDFAFLVWNARARSVIAASDAVGVKRLYWAQQDGIVAFASRAEALALSNKYNTQYLAERVASCLISPTLTPYQGVSAVPIATLVLLERGTISQQPYWSPYEISAEPEWPHSEAQAVDTCRALLAESVRLRLAGSSNTWAQLSGGMDSSSVVSVAQWLAERGNAAHGLAGAFTYVDHHGSGGDERRYADVVARRWRVRHEVIDASPRWDDPIAVPLTDEPGGSLDTVVRDHQVCDLMSSARATALLTGAGGDVLFGGTMFFFADWVARGHLWAAVREMTRRAVIGRASFWELAYRNALLPLLPKTLRRHLMDQWGQVPPWVGRAAIKQHGLHERAVAAVLSAGRIGSKYRDAIAAMVEMIPVGLTVDLIEENVDVRHPYYYRPLVEFALRLPPDLCVRPHARKWVLREAMSGILPELVRTRIGKGSYAGAVSWWLVMRKEIVEPLMRQSILADLGVIDVRRLRAALEVAQYERDERVGIGGAVLGTLSIEAWLQARSGRWPHGLSGIDNVSSNHALAT
jgi:asparagine synthase (glutamine-hydrolysing)